MPGPGQPLVPRVSLVTRRAANVALAALAAAAVLIACGIGVAGLPALGPVLVPGHGAWAAAAGGRLPASGTLRLRGLDRPVAVSFDANGIATIQAASSHDAVLALGYVHARFRLSQLDLQRRLAEGRLAELAGPAALSSDQFELTLGLLRTARQEWAGMSKTSEAARTLVAYAKGVNDYLAQARASGQWPALFSLAGVYPRDWTPVDSLAVQGDLTQSLDYTTTPLDYALLARSLGISRTMAWFPILPVSQQDPYDPGPYRNLGLAPLVTSMTEPATRLAATRLAAPTTTTAGPGRGRAAVSPGLARAAAAMLAVTSALPPGQIHGFPDSNAWAANGPRVAGGGTLLGGDPHLQQTLPPVWFEVAMTAPGMDVTGVSVPGLPGVLIGHNRHIAWSLTDTQNQSALFYAERTSRGRPGQYFWRGQWRTMQQVSYQIPVRGAATARLTVRLTVHGPVMTQAGQTVSVDWMGNVPSPDIAAMIGVIRAGNFAQFRSALAQWRAPTQNFVYADDQDNIGVIAAGYFPVVTHGSPWLPLDGTGASDIAGVIPYQAVPQAYDPPGHVIVTANQRPVAAGYPYYIGTTADSFDPSYRASRAGAVLGAGSLTPGTLAGLQTDLTDQLAVRLRATVLAALGRARLTPIQTRAEKMVAAWNSSMDQSSPGAAIWWTWWTAYLNEVFGQWWKGAGVPVRLDPQGLAISPSQFSLDQVLEQLTLAAPGDPVFSPPGRPARDAPAAITAAFATAVAQLKGGLGGSPASWAWGRLHFRQFPSLTQVDALGYGPRPAGGDPWTVDAADEVPVATSGPSWRMIVHWTGPGTAVAEGIFPGGQSENPASPWYQNLVSDWWNGSYLPIPAAGAPASGRIRWELRP